MPQTMGPPKPSIFRALKRAAKQLWVSQVKYGYALSAYRGESLNAEGSAIPWFTYPAIDFLKQFNLRDKSVFEWGSGNSTLFWAKNAASVKSVEDDEAWFRARCSCDCRIMQTCAS